MLVLGVDPGKTGAWALLRKSPLFNSDEVTILATLDMPILKNQTRTDGLVDGLLLSKWLSEQQNMYGKPNFAIVEEVGAMNGKEARSSMFNFGVSQGIGLGVLQTFNIPIRFVKPAVWKGIMGLSASKEKSLFRVKTLFPKDEWRFIQCKNDGRAESVLIGLFGIERFK